MNVILFYKMSLNFLHRPAGIVDSEPNACKYLIDKKILPPRRTCPVCPAEMAIKACSTTKYSDRFCWKCSCKSKIFVRQHSILEKRQISFCIFLLTCYSWRHHHTVNHSTNLARHQPFYREDDVLTHKDFASTRALPAEAV